VTKQRFTTAAIHAGEIHDGQGAHIAPIYQTSTFTFCSNLTQSLCLRHYVILAKVLNMKRIILLFALLFLISACDQEEGGGGRRFAGEEATPDISSATPQATQPPPTGTTVLADGELVAAKPALPLSFVANGRLMAIHFQEGDVVEEGAVLATLDESALSEAVTSAELQVAQAETALAQAQLTLDDLVDWEPNELDVALAEANLVTAETNYENALAQDSAAGNSLTSARISITQAQRALDQAQETYDNAFDEARDWEQFYDEPTCLPGQTGGKQNPCTGITWKKRIEDDRDFASRALPNAQEALQVAQANYNLAVAGLNDNNAPNAEASIASAQHALDQARTGPKESEIAAARLAVDQTELSLEQAEFNLDQARNTLEDAMLFAPWPGTILSVDTAPGAMVGDGTPILTLLDAEHLQFHTTNLSERDLADIEPGQSVELSLKTYPGQEINGRVVRIVPQSSGEVSDAATFTVVIDLEPSDLLLLPGMTGRAEIQREAEG
jgi:HlyD family secretion protein